MYRKSAILAVTALAVLSATPNAASAAANECKLSRIAEFEMIREPDGKIAVAVSLNGAQHRMLLATSSINSAVMRDFADSNHIPQKHLDQNVHVYIAGGEAEMYGTIDSLTLGSGTGSGLRMIVAPGYYPVDPAVVGMLGTDILGNFDVEFDFAAGKIRLFSNDHCPNIGAYWAAKYAELPIDLKQLGKPLSQWTLDGKPVSVSFDTSAAHSIMPMTVATEKFGLDTGSPGVEAAGNDAAGLPVYRYRFRSLAADGIAVNNPLVALYDSRSQQERCDGKTRFGHRWQQTTTCYGQGDLALGLQELSKLHLYFAYKEKVIYFTAADAH